VKEFFTVAKEKGPCVEFEIFTSDMDLPASCRVFADLASARQAHVYLDGIIYGKGHANSPVARQPVHSFL
jgi:hypothetical protein